MMTIMYLGNQAPFTKGLKLVSLKLKMLLKFLKVKKFADWSAAQITDYFFKEQKLKAIFLGILADLVVRPSQFFGLGVPGFNVETAFDKRIPLKINQVHKGIMSFYYELLIKNSKSLSLFACM